MILILDTFMPKACMRWATSRPIRPRPRIASVLPLSSDPVYSFLSQRPSLSDPQLWATCLHRNTRICSSLKHQLMCIATTVLRTWGLFKSIEVLLYPQIYSTTKSRSQKTLSVRCSPVSKLVRSWSYRSVKRLQIFLSKISSDSVIIEFYNYKVL